MLSRPSITPVLAVALALLAGMDAAGSAVGAIFKCRSADGHWIYAGRPPTGCRGPATILPLTPAVHRAEPPRGRELGPPARLTPRHLRARLRRDEATLRALRATHAPRDPALERCRTHALRAVNADIATLRHDLAAR